MKKEDIRMVITGLRLTMILLFQIIRAESVDKTVVTVYDLKSSGIRNSLAAALREQIESGLVSSGTVEVVTRSEIEMIFREMNLKQSGLCLVEERKVDKRIIPVDKIVTGNVSRIGNRINIVLKLVDAESGKLEYSVNRGFKNSSPDILVECLPELVIKLTQFIIKQSVTRVFHRERIDDKPAVREQKVRNTGLFEAEEMPVVSFETEEIVPKESNNKDLSLREEVKPDRKKTKQMGRAVGVGSGLILGTIALLVFIVQ